MLLDDRSGICKVFLLPSVVCQNEQPEEVLMAKKRDRTNAMPAELRKLRALFIFAGFLPALFGGLLLVGTIGARHEIYPRSAFHLLLGLALTMLALAGVAIWAVVLLTMRRPLVKVLTWILAVAWLLFGIIQTSLLIIGQAASRNQDLDFIAITRCLVGLFFGVSFIRTVLSKDMSTFLATNRGPKPANGGDEDSDDNEDSDADEDTPKQPRRKAKLPSTAKNSEREPQKVASESLTVTCSTCQKQLRVPAASRGKRVKCPGCKSVFSV
jgi:hypothetical protein